MFLVEQDTLRWRLGCTRKINRKKGGSWAFVMGVPYLHMHSVCVYAAINLSQLLHGLDKKGSRVLFSACPMEQVAQFFDLNRLRTMAVNLSFFHLR
jgi:hypothetical protein